MKKVIIGISLISIIGITSVILLNKTKSEAQSNSIDNLVNKNPQGNDANRNNNSIPMHPDNRIMMNPNIPTPDGTNKLPKIFHPNSTGQIKIVAPPETRVMNDCQVIARGNLEVMRKCFEAKIQSNLMTRNATNPNADVAKYNQKVAYCKSKSGNDLSALQFCLNTQGTSPNIALSQEAPSTTFVNASQTKPKVVPNPNAVFK